MGAARPLRFFACGEYGETTARPHFHAILYGLHPKDDAALIEDTWGNGHVYTDDVTPESIAYVAGYTAKKYGWKHAIQHERVDPETGEVYTWRPPFIQMSRRPGIGGHARQWPESWKDFAVINGAKVPVPRFLHESWRAISTEEEIENHKAAKLKLALERDNSIRALEAMEQMTKKRKELKAMTRKL